MESAMSTSPSLQRTILRLVQTNGTIERSALGLRSRSYDPENWEAVLDDLIDRGLITETSEIRVGEKSMRGQKRAVIVYHLDNEALLRGAKTVTIEELGHEESDFKAPEWPDFGKLSAEETQAFVARFPKREQLASNA